MKNFYNHNSKPVRSGILRVSLGFHIRELFLKTWQLSRGQKECWICGVKFAALSSKTLSVVELMHDVKATCNICAIELAKKGLPWTKEKIETIIITDKK